MLKKGPEHLSDDELLVLVLGTGTGERPVLEMASDLLASGGFPALFARGPSDLNALVRGIGPAKATRVAAVLEIAARATRDSLSKKNLLSDPSSVGRYLNRLVKDAPLFRGTLTHAAVAPAPLFRQAILAGAAGVILYHNHPSGDPEPSPEDLATTKRFLAAGREIGIEVKDHVIVGRGRWVSFHERGLLR